MIRITKNDHHHGYSLVELIIAIAIVAILAGISTYSWNRYILNNHLRTAARNIVTDFQHCKAKAASENRDYRITFSTDNDNYTISAAATSNLSAVSLVKTPLSSGEGSAIDITESAFGTGSSATFQKRGITVPSGHVILQNARNSTATITINTVGKAYVIFNMQ
ncbi:MAG: GspH/FimT family protein [Deltaproteobacteria bacterium]|nr:GspH/FimT family protein [Deltaproteobacteria bacterium]